MQLKPLVGIGGCVMQYRLGISCLAILLLASSPCLAEPQPIMVQPVQGGLYVSTGQGFQPVNSAINANVGDTIMVAPGGTAMVAYPDGCKVSVQPGEVRTIARLSPCTNPFPPDGTVAQDTSAGSSGSDAGLAWPGELPAPYSELEELARPSMRSAKTTAPARPRSTPAFRAAVSGIRAGPVSVLE